VPAAEYELRLIPSPCIGGDGDAREVFREAFGSHTDRGVNGDL
jgi:hypothetical protein